MSNRAQEIVQRADKALVFGMEWFPLLGDHPQRQAVTLARRRRASHWVVAAGAVASVGLMRSKGGSKRIALYSAAAAFAGMHPVGTVVAVLRLPHDRLWLVAAHEGAVMARTDQLHDDEADVQETIRLLREAHPTLVVHDESGKTGALLEALFHACEGAQCLAATRRHIGPSLVALLLAGVLALWVARSVWWATDRQVARPEVDSAQVWANAVRLSAEAHVVHGAAGLMAVLDNLQQLPAYLAGWQLQRVECKPVRVQWQCHARYRRDPAGDNQSLIDAALPGWRLSFDPLEAALVTWELPLTAQPLSQLSVYRASENEAKLLSALQSISPAFNELRIEAAQPLPLVTPVDAQLQPVPRPPALRVYQKRGLRLEAPLRSLSLLLPESRHMSWERVILEVGEVVQPTLLHSGLRVSLSGVLYEIIDDDVAFTALADNAHAGLGRTN